MSHTSERQQRIDSGRVLDICLEEQLDTRMRTGSFKDTGWTSVSELVSLGMVMFDTVLKHYIVTDAGQHYWHTFIEPLPPKAPKKCAFNHHHTTHGVMG